MTPETIKTITCTQNSVTTFTTSEFPLSLLLTSSAHIPYKKKESVAAHPSHHTNSAKFSPVRHNIRKLWFSFPYISVLGLGCVEMDRAIMGMQAQFSNGASALWKTMLHIQMIYVCAFICMHMEYTTVKEHKQQKNNDQKAICLVDINGHS